MDSPEAAIRFRLSYTLNPSGTATPRIFLAGELSLTTADRARIVIHDALHHARELICDLADVTFVDVSGVCVLLDIASRAQQGDGRFTVANPPPIVPRILRIFGLEHSLEIDAPPTAASIQAPVTTTTRADLCNATVRTRRRPVRSAPSARDIRAHEGRTR
ncbi:STAS domain-containing protein [Solirubrobacter ginsenosidimutans]|uniref:STAS domain-containing protein n=1 Tax=Solirubrobacter ginsenosidimutans TaxID=490573 RepID=UPI0022CDD249|nr:STAS domain-containing protein [Solirubrobacter ginsenosidimutans]